MNKARYRLTLAAALLPLLAGCNAVFGAKSSHRGDMPQPRQAEIYPAVQLAAGRQALGNRDYGAAISAFRNARFDPVSAPDAYNGLAIAYARIGRYDIAGRYFREAIARAPGDERFKTNLARMEKLAEASAIRFAVKAPDQNGAKTASLPGYPVRVAMGGRSNGAVRVEAPLNHMVRVSSREVLLTRDTRIATSSLAGRSGAAAIPVRFEKPGATGYPQTVRFFGPAAGGGAGMSMHRMRVTFSR